MKYSVKMTSLVFSLLAVSVLASGSIGAAEKLNQPPQGFTALFNGKNLDGWKGLVGSPKTRAKMSTDELAAGQKKADEVMRAHWSVVDGVFVFDGKGKSLCTEKDYANFELYVDWKNQGTKGIAAFICEVRHKFRFGDPALRDIGSGGPVLIIKRTPATRWSWPIIR